MSVRPETVQPSTPSLHGSEGELVCVRVCVEPRLLEKLLETLGGLSFSVNPEIFHQAGIGRVHPDGREEITAATMIEFPAFTSHLEEIRAALPPDSLHVRSMVEDLHSDHYTEAAPAGAPYRKIKFYRRLRRA